MAGTGQTVCYWLTLISGLVECLCFSGILFGWASLVFVLKSDGYFSNLCVNSTVNETIIKDCTKQDEQFSIIFTIASFLLSFMSLPNGILFDYFGTLVTRLIGILGYTSGTLLLAFSNAEQPILLYPALPLIAVGGLLFLITNIQVGNLFGAHRSTIITVYNGAFDSSSAVFLVVKLLHEDGVSLRSPLIFLSCCSIIHVIRTILLMPRRHIPFPLPENYSYGFKCGNANSSKELEKEIDQKHGATETSVNQENVTNKPERSFKSCVFSWLFLCHLLWLSVMQLRHFLFIGTLNPFLNHLTDGDPSLVSTYTNAFAFTQLCGILCAPWNGLILDRNKKKPRKKGQTESEADLEATVLSLALTVIQCVLFSLCAAIPVLPLQYLTFALQVLNRSFIYGGHAAFISVAFPPEHFGKLYGMFMSLAAVVSLLQYLCFYIVSGPLQGNPFNVNVALTILSCLVFIHPIYVYLYCRRQAAERAKENQTDSS